jgi:hypothetical protein
MYYSKVYADSVQKVLSCRTVWSQKAKCLGLNFLPTDSATWSSVPEDSVAIMRPFSTLLKVFNCVFFQFRKGLQENWGGGGGIVNDEC